MPNKRRDKPQTKLPHLKIQKDFFPVRLLRAITPLNPPHNRNQKIYQPCQHQALVGPVAICCISMQLLYICAGHQIPYRTGLQHRRTQHRSAAQTHAPKHARSHTSRGPVLRAGCGGAKTARILLTPAECPDTTSIQQPRPIDVGPIHHCYIASESYTCPSCPLVGKSVFSLHTITRITFSLTKVQVSRPLNEALAFSQMNPTGVVLSHSGNARNQYREYCYARNDYR